MCDIEPTGGALMDYNEKQFPEKPKSRKLFGCLIGCLIAFGVLFLFLIFIAYLLFRAHPSLSEEQFFTPQVIGFARFQMDALQREPARHLFRKVLKNLNPPSKDKGVSHADPDGVWNAMDILFHQRHFLYLYQGEDEDIDYLCVINIKRLNWIFSSILKDVKNADIEKIPSPPKTKAVCFRLKKDETLVFIAIIPPGILISNSQSCLLNSLSILYSEKETQGLSPLAKNLLPDANPLDMASGFVFWRGEWMEDLHAVMIQKRPESKEDIDPLYQVLTQMPLQAVTLRMGLSTTDVLDLGASLQCAGESDAALYAERLSQCSASLNLPEDVEIRIQSEGKVIRMTILIPGVENWLEQTLNK